jgi:PadR family transcriptional regulator, regulatory protein PadR
MPKSKNDKLQGTLILLVLRTLDSRGPTHGYGLCDHIRMVSDELLQVEEGSLYPALHRMEQDEWISSKWVVTDKGRKARV